MNLLTKVAGALRAIANHPTNRNHRIKSVFKYGFVQIAAHLVPGDVCVEFPNHTRLLVSPHMKGAAHYIMPRLCEFEEMAFVMHYLRPGDVFADVGANVGAFTILAAGVAGARVVAFEPSPDTFAMLARNILLNNLQDRARPVHAVAARAEGQVQFSVGLGTENHVAAGTAEAGSIAVRATTLDKELAANPPNLLKVDVEGFETEVFAGATNTLRLPGLSAIVMEKNDLGSRYGFDEDRLHREIRDCGFVPCKYEPFARRLISTSVQAPSNIIYTRDVAAANERLRTAPPFTLDDLTV